MDITSLFEFAVKHQRLHDCSALPYEEYQKLFEIVKHAQPKHVLEIGTGIGFTACVMALASPNAKIDTIEKDAEHARLARDFIKDCFAAPASRLAMTKPNRVVVHNVVAEEYLPTLQERYDLIFFDGFQIHYEFLPHYERLLTPSGILIVGNNHLSSKTSDQFFEGLSNSQVWKVVDKFEDTTVAQRI
ncbi:MAG TPA: class I SAM-dependent methyltransferase [Candidatus Doudnabacteria bacterium]|nr:class I SAM-dependent methyltransferase [Candidatus Doudnabacteria bacterium]